MPYDKSDQKLDSLIAAGLQDPEISDGIKRAKIEVADVYSEIKGDPSQMWEGVTGEIASYDHLETSLKNAREEKAKALGPEIEKPTEPVAVTVEGAGCLVLVLVGAVWGVLRYQFGWTFSFLFTWMGVLAVAGVVALIALAFLLYFRRRKKQRAKQLGEYEVLKAKRTQLETSLETTYPIAAMEKSLADAAKNIEVTLLERKIKPKLRELINSQLNPSYAPYLNIKNARGLAEVFDPKMAIDTQARNSMRFMLENMPGGSIGIAGPRGAGKTTLLRLFCGPKRILTELKGKPILAVLVSAPVAYQARDFILYLFSAVCQSALETEGEKYTRPTLQVVKDESESLAKPMLDILKPVPTALVSLGMALFFVGLLLGLALVLAPPPAKSEQEGKATEQSTAQAQPQSAPVAVNNAEGVPTPTAEPTPSPAPAPTPAPSLGTRSVQAIADFIRAMELKPGQILTWGLVFLVTGFVVGALVGRTPAGLLASATLRFLSVFFPFAPFLDFLRSRLEQTLRQKDVVARLNEARREMDAGAPAESGTLKSEAADWLKRIKFQQSYTSGWSGTLKLPVGLEGGVNNAITLAENQLSLPEISHFFTKFVDLASQKYQVIIGIDELDKLESDEKAQRFLNDIKSVFGLERCFYMVSVSENAMSSFERRGLPFRDVFDSSFDTIIYVDYLNFDSARSLLEQRVVGRPIPFFGLSYSLSGGLARDLIRNFRAIMEFRQANSAITDLESICRAVVHADLKSKLRATAISAKKIDLDPDVDTFLERLYGLENKFSNVTDLVSGSHTLLDIAAIANEDKARQLNREKLGELGEEFATYVYYAATVLEYFKNTLSQQAITQPANGGSLDDLARARQTLSVNPGITRSLLNTFRVAHKLSTPTWPLPSSSSNGKPGSAS